MAEKFNIVEYARQVRTEAAKVTWPSRKETLQMSLVVFIGIAICSALLFGIDAAFGAIVRSLLG